MMNCLSLSKVKMIYWLSAIKNNHIEGKYLEVLLLHSANTARFFNDNKTNFCEVIDVCEQVRDKQLEIKIRVLNFVIDFTVSGIFIEFIMLEM